MASSAADSDTESNSSWTTCSTFDGIRELKPPSIPSEILIKIFRLAIDSCGTSVSRLRTKLACAQVCRNWWIASEIGVDYIVNNTNKAYKLAEHLRNTQKGGDVRSLDISWQGRGKGRGLQLARLIDSCPYLSSLSFTARATDLDCDFLGPGDKYDLLGQHVRASLGRLYYLQSFSLDGDGLALDCSLIMLSLPLGAAISKLSFTGVIHPNNGAVGTSFPYLRAVTSITWGVDEVVPFLKSLAVPPPSRLTTLDLGSPIDVDTLLLLSFLSMLAPKLHCLKLLDGGWNNRLIVAKRSPAYLLALHKLLQRLENVEILFIGVNAVRPGDFEESGAALPRLRDLNIDWNDNVRTECGPEYTPGAVIKMLRALSLESLCLPLEVFSWWTDEEMSAYSQAAEEVGMSIAVSM